MKISKVFQKEFSDGNSKKAYLKACKWVAKNIISKIEMSNSFIKYTKVNNNPVVFRIEVCCAMDDNEFAGGFCERCKQFHKSFYINDQYNCSTCKMQAYRKQFDQKLKIKQKYLEERLNYILEKK